MDKRQRIVKVPKNYYRRVHEARYQRIFGAGAIFRQREMNLFVARAWEQFRSFVDLPSGALGIEFGCGTGINSIIISQQGFRMIGLDISPTAVHKAVELAKANHCSARFFVGDMFDSSLQTGSFDFALNIWTLHAVGEQHLRDKHLSECYRVLKPGGYLFLHNESIELDVLSPDEEIVIQEVEEWNISERTNRFDLPDGGKIEVSFPGHMPPGLSGRRSLREHREELECAGFRVLQCWEELMRPNPSVSGNRVMIVFARKPTGNALRNRRTCMNDWFKESSICKT
ncbi:MAG: class I SAM-dependent methyltransferase [Candidatus Poribacteria bacterium]